MRLASLRVQNFRCLKGVEVDLRPVTPLIGANGSGKSSVLRALQFFFGEYQLSAEDVRGRQPDIDVRVGVTFDDLPEDIADELSPWMAEDGSVTITKVASVEEGTVQTGFESNRRQVPEFQEIRDLPTAPEQVERYRELRQIEPYTDLPAQQSGTRVRAALDTWERDNPEACEPMPDTTLTIGGGGPEDLGELVHLIVLPAVQEAASESGEARSNLFSSLTDILVRSRVTFADGLDALRRATQDRYDELVAETGDEVLESAAASMTENLQRYAPRTSVHLTWDMREVQVSEPRIRAELSESGFQTEIGRQGHGVQRAYLFALLESLALAELGFDDEQDGGAEDDEKPPQPLLLLAIEEPELYQHPVRAQSLSAVLRQLSERSDPPTQVMYATHSPYFVDLDLIEALQLLRLGTDDELPASTVTDVDLNVAAEELWEAAGRPQPRFTGDSLSSRLAIFTDTPVSEGLFATAVVLVEGPEDRALLAAGEEQEEANLGATGIAVLPVGGKTCLDRPLVLFRRLGIPTYVLFDGDAGKDHPESNRLLLRLFDQDPDDEPPTAISETHAVFEKTFQDTVKGDIGAEIYQSALEDACGRFGFAVSDGKKNSTVLQATFRLLNEDGHRSDVLTEVMSAIGTLRE